MHLGLIGDGSFTLIGDKIARYIKIGRLVTCTIDVSWSDYGSAASNYTLVMKNLPKNVVSGRQEVVAHQLSLWDPKVIIISFLPTVRKIVIFAKKARALMLS